MITITDRVLLVIKSKFSKNDHNNLAITVSMITVSGFHFINIYKRVRKVTRVTRIILNT